MKNLTESEFNGKYPIGSSFIYQEIKQLRGGEAVHTRSAAWTMDSGVVVVKLVGKAGCFSIDHLTFAGSSNLNQV
jgi:hypothetical protein